MTAKALKQSVPANRLADQRHIVTDSLTATQLQTAPVELTDQALAQLTVLKILPLIVCDASLPHCSKVITRVFMH